MRHGLLLDHCVEPDGTINAKIMARALGIDVAELLRAAPDQARLQETYSVISIVRPWTKSAVDTWTWYHGKRLERFGSQTPAALVSAGRTAELKDFLEAGEALAPPWSPTPDVLHMPTDVRPAANI
ncbi:hypothetical protein [Limimaricola soesokkakensis]|uniref:hypothetical protein n=1 Tax=Limimaricola soesokkakensis TaxID=1343159 RepID=UPI0035180C53